MIPSIKNKKTQNDELNFTLVNANVSIANALRRTIISDIPCVVFHTFPYSENQCEIIKNTSRFNNEIIKQRLSCVPIHIKDLTIPLENYLLEINVKNNSDNIKYITTEDFNIKDKETGKYLSKNDRDTIFPKNDFTNQYIEFLRLRPALGNNLMGEELSLVCKFSISTAKVNSSYNATSTCFYTNTLDSIKVNDEWSKKEKELKQQGISSDEINIKKKNWHLLEAKRHYIENSFDFKIKTIGVFDNKDLVIKACDILLDSLDYIEKNLNNTEVIKISSSISTISNSYDIILYNYDYTIGKVLEYLLYDNFYNKDKTLTFCGFQKKHPHDDYSIIRLAFKNSSTIDVVKEYLQITLSKSKNIFTSIKQNI